MMREYFGGLTDKRQEGKVKHNLLEIIVMTICAVIAGCDVWEDIADYCRVKETWFRESLHMELKNGIPSHDTIQRVWGMVIPEEFERCFCNWIEAVCRKTEGEIVSIDGKTARRSGGSGVKPIHMVSAWASSQQMVLGQIATDEKSNEITAVPALLDMLDVSGCIITADAMSCQKEIVRKIVEKGADYVLSLKENQRTMCREVEEFFRAAQREPKNYPDIKTLETKDCGHGRVETRTYYLTTEVEWFESRADWRNLRSFGMVRSRVEQHGNVTEDDRYFVSSVFDISSFARAVRKHWGIENSLHWCLDMTFHEDYSRIRKDHSAENMVVVRHAALNILKNFPAKMSLARKRRRCAYDDAFFAEVMLSVHACSCVSRAVCCFASVQSRKNMLY